jgi:hypothetical protein
MLVHPGSRLIFMSLIEFISLREGGGLTMGQGWVGLRLRMGIGDTAARRGTNAILAMFTFTDGGILAGRWGLDYELRRRESEDRKARNWMIATTLATNRGPFDSFLLGSKHWGFLQMESACWKQETYRRSPTPHLPLTN